MKRKLLVNTDTIIPAHSQQILQARVKGTIANSALAVCFPSNHCERFGILSARVVGIVSKDATLPVVVMNVSDRDFTIKKNTNFGTLVTVSSTDIVPVCEPKPTPCSSVNVSERVAKIQELLGFDSLNLDVSERQQLANLLNQYHEAFALDMSELGCFNGVQHSVHTYDEIPCSARPYRHPPHVQADIRRQTQEMLRDGVIDESTSPWSSPVVMVKRKNSDKYRFCVDYRHLNLKTVKDSFPLPNIADCLEFVGQQKPEFFSTLDLLSGYWQIAMHPDSIQKTAFKTQDGLFEFKKMPFGLTNAPSTFQRAMQEVFRGLQWEILLIYLDDVIIFSKTFAEHLKHLTLVFQRLIRANIRLKPEKCKLFQQEVQYLGHILNRNGIATNPELIAVVRDYPRPMSVKELQRFLGLANYYRRFIYDFSGMASPLHKLLQKGVKFDWCSQCESAFLYLKTKLCSAPILAFPDFGNLSFILQCDASDTGISFILAQVQGGKERVIAYNGRSLSRAERSYTVTEREALAIVEGFRHYHSYVATAQVQVITDHAALKWLFSQKVSTGRIARWVMRLQQYSYNVVHRKGSQNTNADALSRLPNWESIGDAEDQVASMVLSGEATSNWAYPVLSLDLIRQEQQKDRFAAPFIQYLVNGNLPTDPRVARRILASADQYVLVSEILYHVCFVTSKRVIETPNVLQLVVPESCVNIVLENVHDSVVAAHFGIQRTLSKVKQRYYWDSMNMDVVNWVRSCESCQQRKSPKYKFLQPLVPLRYVEAPFDRVSVDFLGPLPTTGAGNKYVLCYTDHCTRWPVLVPLPNAEATSVARSFFHDIVCNYGCPKFLLSDRGANFLGKVMRECCRLMGTLKLNTTAYHPQCNGLQERFNRVILDTVSHYVNEKQNDWDSYLPAIQFAYRSTSADNSTGYSPYFLLFGREATQPLDVSLEDVVLAGKPRVVQEHVKHLLSELLVARQTAKRNMERSQQVMKKAYDANVHLTSFDVGDTVWLFVPRVTVGLTRKLAKLWCGPYLVTKAQGSSYFLQNLTNGVDLKAPVHINRLKLAYHREVRPTVSVQLPDGVIDMEDDEVPEDDLVPISAKRSDAPTDATDFVVEKILKCRVNKGNKQFLIKWKGFPASQNTWEPEGNLNQACRDYLVENPVRVGR
jgi:hypothetical protein